MKNLKTTFLTFSLLALLSVPAFAQNKVATVDMKKIFNDYYKTKLATAALDNRKVDFRKEIKDMSDGYDKAQADYKQVLEQANDQAISAEERAKRKQAADDLFKDLSDRKAAFQQFQRQAEAQLTDQSQRMSGNLVTEIQKAVAEKAKAGGYTPSSILHQLKWWFTAPAAIPTSPTPSSPNSMPARPLTWSRLRLTAPTCLEQHRFSVEAAGN